MSVAVLRILEEFPDGQATIEQIKKRIPDYIMLTEGDLQPSQTRSGEALWEQIVRNIVSHGNVGTAGNIITEGYVEHQPGKLRITDAGRRHLRRLGY